jgi:CheY-like chemotaxis protein
MVSILVVEDEFRFEHYMTLYLEERGYDVFPFNFGNDAIGAIEEGLKYDLAIIDYSLRKYDCGGPSGPDVIAASKTHVPEAPVICLTGYTDVDKEPKAEHIDPTKQPNIYVDKKRGAQSVLDAIAGFSYLWRDKPTRGNR